MASIVDTRRLGSLPRTPEADRTDSVVPTVVLTFAQRRRPATRGWIDLTIAFANDNDRRAIGTAGGVAEGAATMRSVDGGAARV